jgi:hypothetical protein
MKQEKNQFRLIIHQENQSTLKIDVIDTITVGLDPRNDLVLVGKKINNRHLVFELKGENLALNYLGFTNQTFLNNLPLEEGKTYLLEVGDKINSPGVEIIVVQELVFIHETQKIKPEIFKQAKDPAPPQLAHLPVLPPTPEVLKEDSFLSKKIAHFSFGRSKGPTTESVQEPLSKDKVNFLSLWLVKFYAMICDVFFTYLFLSVILPLLKIDRFAKDIFYYFTSVIFPFKQHSFYYFLVAWYVLSFAQTLIFGTTISQFLLGLRYKSTNSFFKIIYLRVKAFVFSLCLLPAQNTYKSSLTFKAMRKVGMIIILSFILFSPFTMPVPFNTQVTAFKLEESAPKELHTRTVNSYSKDLGMELSTELPYRYLLLPMITGGRKRRSFQFFDLLNNQSIIVEEKEDFTFDDLEERLKYSNPLFSLFQRTALKDLTLKEKKELIVSAILITPVHLKYSAKSFGPFFGSALLLKSLMLDKNPSNDIVLKTYRPETPVMFLASTQQDLFYLFERQGLTRFQVEGLKNSSLVATFERDVFSKLVSDFNPQVSANQKSPTILSVQDAFLHGDEETILTYYVEVANSLLKDKIVYEEVDMTEKAKLALIGNIKSVQKFITDVNVYRSFNKILNQLAPMEKPGEKR